MRWLPHIRTRRDGERGVAAVEFALILTLFFTLVMGAMDWGWFFFVHQRVVNAAREGARAGSIQEPPEPDAADTAALEAAAVSEAEDAAEDYLQRVHLQRTGVTADIGSVTDGDGNTIRTVRVEIVYPFTGVTGFFSGLGLLPDEARAVSEMRWE